MYNIVFTAEHFQLLRDHQCYPKINLFKINAFMYRTKVRSKNKTEGILQVSKLVVNQKKVINIKNKYVCTRKLLYSSIS